jgi:hypothetical protein
MGGNKILKFNFYLQFEWKPKLKEHNKKTFVLGIVQKNEEEG